MNRYKEHRVKNKETGMAWNGIACRKKAFDLCQKDHSLVLYINSVGERDNSLENIYDYYRNNASEYGRKEESRENNNNSMGNQTFRQKKRFAEQWILACDLQPVTINMKHKKPKINPFPRNIRGDRTVANKSKTIAYAT